MRWPDSSAWVLSRGQKVALFLAVALGGSWSLALTFHLLGGQWGGAAGKALGVLYSFPPLIGALWVQGAVAKHSVLGPFGLRFSLNRWWLVAWLLPVLWFWASLGLAASLSGQPLALSPDAYLALHQESLSAAELARVSGELSAASWPPIVGLLLRGMVFGVTANALFALVDEIGWRGFMFANAGGGFGRRAAVSGLASGLWLAPLVALGYLHPEHPLLGPVLAFLWALIISPLLCYLRVRGDSLYPVAIFRGTFMALSALPFAVARGDSLMLGLVSLPGLAVGLVLVGGVLLVDRFASKRPVTLARSPKAQRGGQPSAVALVVLLGAASWTLVLGGCERGGKSESAQVDVPAFQAHPTPSRSAATQVSTADAAAALPPKRVFARRYVAKIRSAPDRHAPRIGYLRAGAVLQAKTAKPVGREGCRGGWYELRTGGFVCAKRDVLAFEGRRLPARRSAQPDRSALIPYAYGRVLRSGTPMYRRLPSVAEVREVESPERHWTASLRPLGDGGAATGAVSTGAVSTGAVSTGAADGGVLLAKAPAAKAADGGSAHPESNGVDAGSLTLARLEAGDGDVLMRRLMRSFQVSLDREFKAAGRTYWRTQSNGFVPTSKIMVSRPNAFRGVVLTEEADGQRLPLFFVTHRRAQAYYLNEKGRLRKRPEPPTHRSAFPVASERVIRGRTYYQAPDGTLFRESHVRRIDVQQPPKDVGPKEKWIDVDLEKQSLIAYEGARPVYVTLVSSGRKRRNDPDDFLTPTGDFRISAKHLTAQMDGDTASDGPYSIEDVPYVMYFQLAYALHSAFWHNAFGRPRSHGCVNIAPHDARWLFEWSEPKLPMGWHGVYPDADHPGTRLVIRGVAPRPGS